MAKPLHSREYSAFVRVLINARKQQNLTQQQVADRLGKSQSYVAKVERCERRVDVVEFTTLAKAMNCDPKILFEAFIENL